MNELKRAFPASPDVTPPGSRPPRIAVLIPCFNEEVAIGRVIADFRECLPDAEIHVFDNNSTDATAAIARRAGALVRSVPLQGKGNVVRRMFADVDADLYLMVDGDDTYDPGAAPALVARLGEGLDMVVGERCNSEASAYRPGHRFGNKLLTRCVGLLFGRTFNDMLSGYRGFSRRYVKSFPAHASGFDIETELAVHALQLRMPVAEVKTDYGARPEGSESKLRTYHDGLRILVTILRLWKVERPLLFFSVGAAACALLSIVLAVPLVETYLQTGLVPRFPTAILCAALMLLGGTLAAVGLILDTVTHGRLELKHLTYLAIPPLPRTAVGADSVAARESKG
ncbi:glycosyltransferase family 2 protein [Novilysobacter erysipheiresistens]|uniref:Glycosyltransferase family 2 protein n=1 Tax=Novilysobacter erysipheiresistens TaxID=1749332 RepID=A0ABU7YWI8_9GAMM